MSNRSGRPDPSSASSLAGAIVARPRRNRRGATATYVAVALPVIGGFGAFGIEIAYLHLVRTQLQVVADSSAHAANLNLDRTLAGMTLATAEAQAVAAGTFVNGRSYALDVNDIEYGSYDKATGIWLSYPGAATASEVNGVRVTPTEPNVGLGFGQAFFSRTFPVGVCAAVIDGPGTANTGVIGGPGLANGHFDYDTTNPATNCPANTTCNSTTKHTHEYDDKVDVTGVALFNPNITTGRGTAGSITGHLSVTPMVPASTPFKILVINADLSPGAWLTVNGVNIDVVDWDNTAFTALPTYALGAGVAGTTRLTSISVNFDIDAIANCELIPSVTGSVRANTPGINNEWRAGALTIQFVRPAAPVFATTRGAGGGHQPVATKNNGLLYESTFFWHWGGAAYTAGTAAQWQTDYDALECAVPEFVDVATSGGTVCP